MNFTTSVTGGRVPTKTSTRANLNKTRKSPPSILVPTLFPTSQCHVQPHASRKHPALTSYQGCVQHGARRVLPYPTFTDRFATLHIMFLDLKHFKSATTGVASKTMRNELNRLVQTVSDPDTKRVRPAASPVHPRSLLIDSLIIKVFDTEMQSFFYLFTRYLTEKAKCQELYAISTQSRGL